MDIVIVLSAVLVLVVAGFVVAIVLMSKNNQRTITAYDRLLGKRDAEYADLLKQFGALMDRFYAKHNLAPANVNLTHEFQEKQSRARIAEAEKKIGGPKPHRVGPVDAAGLAMEQFAQQGGGARGRAIS